MSVRLFVANLPFDATESELRDHFSAVALPSRVTIVTDRATGRPRGFAFVEFDSRDVAERVIAQYDGQPFKSRALAVAEARPRDDRGPVDRPRTPRPTAAPPAVRPSDAPREPAPRRSRAAPDRRQKFERGPRGPIPIRSGGRFYNVDDDSADDLPDFDDFATRAEPENDDA